MDAKELRIGNLIFRREHGKYEVDTISGYDLLHSEKLNEPFHLVEWTNIIGIPLSLKWLLKLGFIKTKDWGTWDDNEQGVYSLKDINIAVTEGKCLIWIDNGDNDVCGYTWFEVPTVHRLQNIYFDIYSKMLEIVN